MRTLCVCGIFFTETRYVLCSLSLSRSVPLWLSFPLSHSLEQKVCFILASFSLCVTQTNILVNFYYYWSLSLTMLVCVECAISCVVKLPYVYLYMPFHQCKVIHIHLCLITWALFVCGLLVITRARNLFVFYRKRVGKMSIHLDLSVCHTWHKWSHQIAYI